MTLTRLTCLLALAASPALGQMVTPNTPRVTYPSAPTWGVGAGRANINLLSTRRFVRWDSVPPPIITPTPCPPRPCPPSPCPTVPRPPETGVRARFSSGAGLTVDGSYAGDKWTVGFHLGTGGDANTPWSRSCESPVVLLPVGSSIPSVYWSGVGTYRSTRPETGMLPRGDGPLDPRLFSPRPMPPGGTPPRVSPATSEPPSAFDAGLTALRDGEHALAVAALRRHLRAHPDDAPAMRALAIALLETKAFDDAAGVMRSAYRADVLLASEPLFPASVGYTNARYRSVLTRAVSYANRVNTASGWLLVAVLMQGEGRAATAAPLLDKAAKLGLERPIAESLAAELTR